jgi:hypothetical protein
LEDILVFSIIYEFKYLWVQFEFVDDGKDQNIFQGDTLNLEWTFNANQEAGVFFFIKKSGNTRFFIIFLPQLLGWH